MRLLSYPRATPSSRVAGALGVLFALLFLVVLVLPNLFPPTEVQRSLSTPIGLRAQATASIGIGLDRRIDLTGEMARYLILPYGTSTEAALQAFAEGRGKPLGAANPLATDLAEGSSSAYVLFAYHTEGTDPIYFRYRSIAPLLVATWLAEPDGPAFELKSVSGADAPRYADLMSVTKAQMHLMTTTTLPAAPRPNLVLVRMDSVFPQWSNLTLAHRHHFETMMGTAGYFDGIFLGAVLAAMGFGLYGLYRRPAADHVSFLLAAAMLCSWSVVMLEHSHGGPWVGLRRAALAAPLFAYFLLHGFGVGRLLYPPDQPRGPIEFWRLAPLWLALAGAGLGLALNLMYAALGPLTVGISLLNPFNEGLFVLLPISLAVAIVLAAQSRLPGYGLLLLGEIIAIVGSVLQLVRISGPWLDGPITSALSQYPLPLEVLVWALALNSRLHYLEMVAKDRVDAALAREAARVRAMMQESVDSREQALAALDSSYRTLDQSRRTMRAIVGTHAHAARGLLLRLGSHLERLGRLPQAEAKSETAAADFLLDELAGSIAQSERAVDEARTMEHAAASANSLLRWHVEARRGELAARDIGVDLRCAADAEGIQVDGYPFMEAARELLGNVARYAAAHSVARIELSLEAGHLALTVANQGELRAIADAEALRHGLPVPPAERTLNGETSSGRGLAALRGLLADMGASLDCQCEAPDRFTVHARFPVRANSPLQAPSLGAPASDAPLAR